MTRPIHSLSVKGTFITLEGPEGSGKTVLAKRLAEELHAARPRRPLDPRNPGERGSASASGRSCWSGATAARPPPSIRAPTRCCSTPRGPSSSPRSSGRRSPRARSSSCARYADSTLAYQGYGAGLPIEELRALAADRHRRPRARPRRSCSTSRRRSGWGARPGRRAIGSRRRSTSRSTSAFEPASCSLRARSRRGSAWSTRPDGSTWSRPTSSPRLCRSSS